LGILLTSDVMSENLSALSSRHGAAPFLFERLVAAPDGMHALGEASRFGDAMTLGAASFYDFLRKEDAVKKVRICNGSACLCAGTQDGLRRDLAAHFTAEEIGSVCCLGRCHEGRAFQFNGRNYSGIPAVALAAVFADGGTGDPGGKYVVATNMQQPQLTAPGSNMDVLANLVRPLFANGRDWLAAELKASNLRGRGGAGFPLHLKWQACRIADGAVKYVVCNADEGDPGSYIDRYLMEQRPHGFLLGMMVAGWFAGAAEGVVYIRAEYPESAVSVRAAIAGMETAGLLGENILGSGFDFTLRIVMGAGAYICGEETALLASIEGQRPEVRVRPPFPTTAGLFLKPTIVNNVETFANLPAILALGGKGYAQTGTLRSSGPKLLSLDSQFVNPGIYEVAMGTPLASVVALAGGFKSSIKALHIGGPLGGIVPVSQIDRLTVDFESFTDAGFLLGHGGFVSIPQEFPMIAYLEHLFGFTAAESCGKCFPCRLGSVRGRELLEKARADSGFRIDRTLFLDLLETLEQTSLCGLGGGLPLPVRNAMEYFADELNPYFNS
jgi:NADH:ubiquinone oxidoreductase subunit F (NADH-binding)